MPRQGEPACRQRSYVVNGDTVVTGRDLGRYRCAFFPNKVVAAPAGGPQQAAAVAGGRANCRTGWATGKTATTACASPCRLDNCMWMATPTGLLPTPRRNSARMARTWAGGRATPRGADVEFVEDTCRVRVHSLGEVLIVADNSECGGMNVRFNGVYRRAGKR